MRAFKQPGTGPVRTHGLARSERNRLILFSALLVVILGALVATWTQRTKYERAEVADLPAGAELPEVVPFVPEIDAEALDALVDDAEPADRVVLETEAVDYLLERVRKTTPASFVAMGAEPLDAGLVAEILADPSAHRGEAFVARGTVETVRTRRRGFGGERETRGRLLLEDGTPVYFLVRGAPEGVILGDFVRIDGLFLKVFSDEDRQRRGSWIEGPLLVGSGLVRSAPSFGPVTELGDHLDAVEDDSVAERTGIPSVPLWRLMAFARDLPEDAVEWSEAPVLDRALLSRIREDGGPFRGEPFVVPISKLAGAGTRRAGENPARIESYTEGWIGNTQWKHPIHFKAPFVLDEPRLYDSAYDDYVRGRGFFLKNWAYEPVGGGIAVAPIFVLSYLELYEPKASSVFAMILWGAVILFSVLLVTFTILLTRDKRSSEELQRRLLERRRARRAAAGASGSSHTST